MPRDGLVLHVQQQHAEDLDGLRFEEWTRMSAAFAGIARRRRWRARASAIGREAI